MKNNSKHCSRCLKATINKMRVKVNKPIKIHRKIHDEDSVSEDRKEKNCISCTIFDGIYGPFVIIFSV